MADLDIVIPTIPGREASLARLLDSIERYTTADYNEFIVRDSPTCGEGWMTGLERVESDYIWLACDDLEVITEAWDLSAIEAVDENLIACPRVYTPEGLIESQGGDMNVPMHIRRTPAKNGTRVDYTTVPFLNRAQAEAIGMIPIQYCCDVWVSYRGRQLDYETALVHGYDLVHHYEQVGRGAGMSQGERNAIDERTLAEALAASSLRC